MKNLCYLAILAAGALNCRAQTNPIITNIFTADPSAHVWGDGRLYVYASHDMNPPRGCDLMDRYHVFSTDDMAVWTDHGEILRASDVEWGRKEGGFMWAPDCAYKNGTYYFYFPHPSDTKWNDSWKIGVATSKNPAGGFKSQGYIEGLGGFALIDPCVFVDSDGQAYIYIGGGGKCLGAKLKPGMTELESEVVPMAGLEDFHEAAWVFKRKDLYYLAYADNHQDERKKGANRMRYATGKSPLGPWQYQGVYLDSQSSDTSHGSVVEFKGQWYQFYHCADISGRGNLRSVCADKLFFNEDGTIKPVKQTRSAAIPAPRATGETVKYEAESASPLQFNRVDGKSGGMSTISVYFSAEQTAKLRLVVNDEDWSFINAIAGGCCFLSVPLKPGKTNTVKLVGDADVACITVTPLP
jgi:beta-xylosidase